MTFTNSATKIYSADYLEAEKISPIKQEYKGGEIYEIPETSDAHDTIFVNSIALLRNHIRCLGYHIYTGNMKVNVDEETNIFYYPDVTVTGDERDKNGEYCKRYPCLIVEITSSITEAFERGEKFADYRKLESLQEYVLISQERVNVECFRRNSEGDWIFQPYSKGDEVYFASIDFRTPIATLYEDLLIPPTQKYTTYDRKIRTQKYLKFPVTSSMLAVEQETPSQIPTEVTVKPLANNNKPKTNIFGLGAAIILSLAGSQMYSYWEKTSSINKVSASQIAQANIIGMPAFSTDAEPVKLSEENDKEQIPSNNLSPVLQIGKPGESEAKDIIGLINRTQKGFFSENGRFASTWSDLGFQVKSKNEDYEYKISWSDRAKTIVIAIAKKPGLKSYSGVVVVEGETAVDKICETNEPSDTPPVLPEVTGKDIECPSMSSSISGDSRSN